MKIKIIKQIKPLGFSGVEIIEPGIYEAIFNPHGAVTVKDSNGKKVGIMLHEFKFMSREDRDKWIKIAFPQIPDVAE